MYFAKVKKPRAILFDLGDTLINHAVTNPLPFFEEGAREAHDYLCARAIRVPSFKSYLRLARHMTYLSYGWARFRGREVNLMHVMRRLHRMMHLPTEESLLLEVADRFYHPMKVRSSAEEGLHGILEDLVRRGHPLAIVSNTMVPPAILDRQLEEMGLLRFFPVRVYSCEIGVRKPRSPMYREALRSLNMRPQDSIFVGDKIRVDIVGAKKLGMITVVKVRRRAIFASDRRADYVIRHLSELPSVLEQIGACFFDSVPLVEVGADHSGNSA